MSYLESIRKQFLPGKYDENQPVVHEALKRRTLEIASYDHWRQSSGKEEFTQYIYHQYQLSKILEEDEDNIRFIASTTSKGFLLRFQSGMKALEFQHFFDFLKEYFLNDNYHFCISDRRIYTRKRYAETVERHHLKPEIRSFNSPPVNQYFGNINIELHKINDVPTHIELQCTHYNNLKYSEALSFEEMIEMICNW